MSKVLHHDIEPRGYLKRHTLTLEDRQHRQYQREFIARGHSACVLCVDLKNGLVLLVEQFRPGASPEPGAILECVAGMIDEHETAEQAICREAREEAGLTLQTDGLIRLGCVMLSPGVLQETSTIFLAITSLSNIDTEKLHGQPDEHEEIRLVPMSFSAFFRFVFESEQPVSATLHIAASGLKKLIGES